MKPRIVTLVRLLVLIVFACLTANAQAPRPPQPQSALPQRIVVAVTQVRPAMVGTYQDLIKNEANPALKRAGLSYRWTFAPTFGTGFTFISVQPVSSFTQYDQPGLLQRGLGADGLANYNAKLRPAILTQRTMIETLDAALSIVSPAASLPAVVVVQTFQVAPGHVTDFNALMASDYIPAYRKAGVKEFWVYDMTFGASGGQILTFRPISDFAELDQPGLLQRAGLSPDAIQAMNAKRNAFILNTETDVDRLIPDLSFGTPFKAAN
jgi:hypothetical protein